MSLNGQPPTSGQSEEYLPYDLKYIPEEIRERAKSELFEDEETKFQSLKQLRSMLKEETNLNWQDEDLFLLAFLRAKKYDVKRAFILVKNFYKIIRKHDELYLNFNYDDVRRALEENTVWFLPYRDHDGCAILVLRAEPWNPNVNTLGDMLRAVTCGMLHAICSPATQITGVKVIIDFSGFGLSKLLHFTPSYMWLLAEALQNTSPVRVKAIHSVNEAHILYYGWSVLKQFLSKKMKNRFHFHGRHVKTLHKSFSPEILPAEFGGELPPFDNSKWAAKMAESSAYFSHVFSHGYKKKEKESTGM